MAEKIGAVIPTNHKATHQNNGADEISVADLSGELADAQKTKVEQGTTLPITGNYSGRLFWKSDDAILYRHDGASWVKVGVQDYADLDDIPATFTPTSHDHSYHTDRTRYIPIDFANSEFKDPSVPLTPAYLTPIPTTSLWAIALGFPATLTRNSHKMHFVVPENLISIDSVDVLWITDQTNIGNVQVVYNIHLFGEGNVANASTTGTSTFATPNDNQMKLTNIPRVGIMPFGPHRFGFITIQRTNLAGNPGTWYLLGVRINYTADE